jgi:hypothetical protein
MLASHAKEPWKVLLLTSLGLHEMDNGMVEVKRVAMTTSFMLDQE